MSRICISYDALCQSVRWASMEPTVTKCVSVRMEPNVTTSAELVPVPPAGWVHIVKRVSNKQMHSNSERFTYTNHKNHVYGISRVVSIIYVEKKNVYFNAYYFVFSWPFIFLHRKECFHTPNALGPLLHQGNRKSQSVFEGNPPIMQSECVSVCKMECF